MNLQQCALVTQGVFLSRIQPNDFSAEVVKIPVYTMREMNDWLNPEPTAAPENPSPQQDMAVPVDRMPSLPIAKEGWVIISLTGQRAVALREEHAGKLIPSNFAIIEPNGVLNPSYLEWFINEHPECRRQIKMATQGSSIGALSIQMLRTLEVILPPLNDQVKIGSVYRLLHRKNQLLQERILLERQFANQLMMGYLKEELK